MTEIPEDIRKAAQAVYAGYVLDVKQRYAPGVSDIEELVTRHAAAALMAERVSATERERERCAKIADAEAANAVAAGPNAYAVIGAIVSRIIAAAIREGTPSGESGEKQ